MTAFLCPVCRAPLTTGTAAWRCAGGHAFDVAREGYVNLLPVQHKHSRSPGDSAGMLRARRAFLAAGHYAPLRDAVVDLLRPLGAERLLDLGCGEGWYTGAMTAIAADVTGIDIAKDAVRLAARAHPGIVWLVATGASLPVADGAVDLVTSLFAPLPAAELARVTAPGGHLLVVAPAADHLATLRAALFEEVRPHAPEKFAAELAPAFVPARQQDVRFALHLRNEALRQLLAMTPYAWRAKPARRAALEAMDRFGTTAAFSLLLLRRAG